MRPASILATIAGYVKMCRGFRRFAVAGAAGAASVLAMPPFFAAPALFVTLPVLVWLVAPEHVTTDAETPRFQLSRALLWRGFAAGWWFGFGYFFAGLYWIGSAFLVQAEVFAWLLPFAVTAMPAGLALFVAVCLAPVACLQGSPILRVVALALAISAAEYLRGHMFTGFPWNTIGYALTNPLSFMQVSAVIGIYGLTLITILVFATPAVIWAERSVRGVARDRRDLLFVGGLTVVPLLAIWLYGLWVLSLQRPGALSGVKVRIVQPSIRQSDKFVPELRREIFERHVQLSQTGSRGSAPGFEGITHVIWPEAAMPFLGLRSPEVAKRIAEVFPDDVKLIAGTLRLDGPLVRDGRRLKVYNSSFAMDGAGALLSTYDKVHLVPFGEYLPFQNVLEAIGLEQLTRLRGGFAVGRAPRPIFNVPLLPEIGMLICYEIVFPNEIVTASGRPGLLINLTNDAWFGHSTGPYQHFHQARVRAVEQGLPLIRVGNNGISAIIDPRGRIWAQLALDQSAAIDSAVPRSQPPTVYTENGDLIFFLLWSILCFIIIIKSVRNSRQRY
ncbi:MAG: apolipoprotein N-acyltransferase [Hyphomicrobiaceae bacterium]